MNKYLSAALAASIILAGCADKNEKAKDDGPKSLTENDLEVIKTTQKKIDNLTRKMLKEASYEQFKVNTAELRVLNTDLSIKDYEIPKDYPLAVELRDLEKDKTDKDGNPESEAYTSLYMTEKLKNSLKPKTNVDLLTKSVKNKWDQNAPAALRKMDDDAKRLVENAEKKRDVIKKERMTLEKSLDKYRKMDPNKLIQKRATDDLKEKGQELTQLMTNITSKMSQYRDNSPFKVISITKFPKDENFKLMKIDRTDIKDERRFYTEFLVDNSLAKNLKKGDIHHFVVDYKQGVLPYPVIKYIADKGNKKWSDYTQALHKEKMKAFKLKKELDSENADIRALERLKISPSDSAYIQYVN